MAVESDRIGTVTTSPALTLVLTSMVAVERLSELFVIEADVVSRGGPVDLHPCLAKPVEFAFDHPDASYANRIFHGILCEYAEIASDDAAQEYNYRLVVRPQQYLKSLNRKSQIFYNKTLTDLISLLATQEANLQGSYGAVEYRVQHEESDFAFVSRHMEREGVYYHFKHAAGSHTLVACDAPASHQAGAVTTVKLTAMAPTEPEAVLTSMQEHRRIGPTAYTVDDYDYTAPTVSLKKTKTLANVGSGALRYREGSAADVSGNIAELFEHPGEYDNAGASRGETYASVRLQAQRAGMARCYAEGTLFSAAVGTRLTVQFIETSHNGFGAEQQYLIVATRHHYRAAGYRSGSGGNEDLRVELELVPASMPFRPERKTPMPRIMGPQTGVVVGPPGEEIYTDKYGRVKVKFFWDTQPYQGGGEVHARSLWVRTAQMSAGNGFGAFMIPRIGHEVVVEFLNGDPDRPLVTGSVYNENNLPAFGDAGGNPVQGLRTNSSKGGGGFNEIRLDDTKDAEVFSVQAQKDLKTLVLKGNEIRDIKEGNRTTTIDKGDETLNITQGKRTESVKGNDTLTVEQGNREATISQGNDTLTISQGNRTTAIKMGNDSLKLDMGSQTTEAMQAIELKVGTNSIKIDQTGVTIKGMMVTIEATGIFKTKGAMMQQEAQAIHIVKGAMVMIN